MKILINRSDAIGDAILTMPIAQLIKETVPGANVVFIVSPKCEALLKYHQYIDDIWILDVNKSKAKNFARLYKLMREFAPDCYLYVGGSQLPSFVAFLRNVKIRGGLKSRWQTFFLLNKGVRQIRSLVEMHEVSYNLKLLEVLNIRYDINLIGRYKPTISLTERERSGAWQTFELDLSGEHLDSKKELIFIHPGMRGHTLNWPGINYGRLILALEERYPNRFLYVVSYTSGDNYYLKEAEKIISDHQHKHIKKSVHFYNGERRGLRNFMGVLSRAKLYIGPSTGPTHIANALGVKLVGIYSPIKVQSALRWGPFSRSKNMTRILVPDVICGENFTCANAKCPYYECMSKIEVDDVAQAVSELLAQDGNQ